MDNENDRIQVDPDDLEDVEERDEAASRFSFQKGNGKTAGKGGEVAWNRDEDYVRGLARAIGAERILGFNEEGDLVMTEPV